MKSLPRDCVRLTHQNKRSFSSSVMRACLCTYVFPRTFVCVCLLTLDWNGTPSSWHHNLIPSHSWVNSSPLSSGDGLTAAGHSEECLYSFERAIFSLVFRNKSAAASTAASSIYPPLRSPPPPPDGNGALSKRRTEKVHHNIACEIPRGMYNIP